MIIIIIIIIIITIIIYYLLFIIIIITIIIIMFIIIVVLWLLLYIYIYFTIYQLKTAILEAYNLWRNHFWRPAKRAASTRPRAHRFVVWKLPPVTHSQAAHSRDLQTEKTADFLQPKLGIPSSTMETSSFFTEVYINGI